MILALESMDKIFFCTGARNEQLLKEFGGQDVYFEYDERMASFKALGLAKIKGAPVAVCTTSGTAVAQCLGAMLEARYSQNPLVLITGDRPKKLHGTGSPQTIDHEALTRGARGSYLEIPLEEFKSFEIQNPCWPVHINVLVDDTLHHTNSIQHHSGLWGLSDFLRNKNAPLFLFSHEEKSIRPLIEKFKDTGHLFFAETLSGGRELSPIKHEKDLLELHQKGEFDCVLRVGHTPLSKLWRLLEKRPMPILSLDSRGLSALSFGEVIKIGATELINDSFWWEVLEKTPRAKRIEGPYKLAALMEKYPYSEISWMKRIQDNLPEGSTIYLGNSLTVRFFELTQEKRFEAYGSRGVNGIDGQLATAIGLALGTKKPITCILGDITTLYDLSSLREMPKNLKLIIMNNGGGRIFEMLHLDRRIVMEHENNFEKICQGLGVSYSRELSGLPEAQVVEIRPIQAETKDFLSEWNP